MLVLNEALFRVPLLCCSMERKIAFQRRVVIIRYVPEQHERRR
jgi:hypothetical protein